MSREPIGFFQIPSNWNELSEDEKEAVAQKIGDAMAEALRARRERTETASSSRPERHTTDEQSDAT